MGILNLELAITALTLLAIFAGGYFVVKRQSAQTAADALEVWRSTAEAWHSKANQLNEEIKELHERHKVELAQMHEENTQLKVAVAHLEAKVDELKKRDMEAVLTAIETHHTDVVKVLGQIVEALQSGGKP